MSGDRWRSLQKRDDGWYTLELLGVFPFFALVAIMAFQLAAIGGAMNMAENAARNGSRMLGVGGNARAAATASVDPDMVEHTSVSVVGAETVQVRIDVPVVIPFIDLNVITIERQATLPNTTGVY